MAEAKVDVDGREIELSSLSKELYPGNGIVKAEVVHFVAEMAPYILRHLSGRPISLVRFPEGIEGERFFQKNLPKGAPGWVHHVRIGQEKQIDYVVPVDAATLVWLSNMAALEFHQMNVREPHLDRPDHLAFDIDPDPQTPFSGAIEIALALRVHLESYGYTPFVKTSGQKGIHVVVPIPQEWDVDTCLAAAKEIAAAFVKKQPTTTLQMNKLRRKGRTLIDVIRNARGQTMVAAYSLRGAAGGPVSAPLSWGHLELVKHPSELNIHTVPEMVRAQGDPWEAIGAYAAPLHNQRPTSVRVKAEKLSDYAKKRDFKKTREPLPKGSAGKGNRFVIQRHHASHLHYDLRLEENGVLKSWAVPKGLPPRPGIKRLAVQTEDHPLEYLSFEGTIPRGEYGGGQMWVFASGRYEVTKRSRSGMHVRLHSPGLGGEYRLYKTGEKEWMVERIDNPPQDWLKCCVDPMLAAPSEYAPEGEDYVHEVKWDGIRVLVAIDEGKIRLYTRNGNDVSRAFPELDVPGDFRTVSGLFDGEIVALGTDGKPDFQAVVSRVHRAQAPRKKDPAIHCILFDAPYLDGRVIAAEPLVRRREWLEDALRQTGAYRVSTLYEDGFALLESMEKLGLEGIISKRRESPYRPGRRTDDWLKIKVGHSATCVVIGYTEGEGSRRSSLGALHLAEPVEGELVYRGKVGTGMSERLLKQLARDLLRSEPLSSPVAGLPKSAKNTRWVEPLFVCEVGYSELTKEGRLRDPRFVGLRLDTSPEELLEQQTA